MFKKILFPTDFSDVARKAMKYITQLKGAEAQEVIALHVIDEKELTVLSSRAPDQYLRIMETLDKEVSSEMTAVETALTSDGFRVRLEVRTGNPFKVIMDTAAKEKVSIIVLGSHGRSNIAEMLMGSVSENVIRHAGVPLLVISREK